MRQVARVGLARLPSSQPSFLVLSADELGALLLLPELARVLYLELVKSSNFQTGTGTTSWARLAELCGHPNPRTTALVMPSIKALRVAWEHLEAVRLVERDRRKNEGAKALYYAVMARRGATAPKFFWDRHKGSGKKPGKQALARLAAESAAAQGQTSGQGVQEESSSSISPSTTPSYAQPPTPAQTEAKSAADALRGAFQEAPPGGQDVAPSGRTPPRAQARQAGKEQPASPVGDKAARGRHSARLLDRLPDAVKSVLERGGAPKAEALIGTEEAREAA